ncbi:PEP-CTERM sorting domain-containing protein [Nostoc sp.]|uniref:PEP-CTERM sorting domain-containing protein n=1 Tax=Nostoc sp. TaxID=1180 RepID=UPI003FA54FEB
MSPRFCTSRLLQTAVSVEPVPEPSTVVGSLVVLCGMLLKKRFSFKRIGNN